MADSLLKKVFSVTLHHIDNIINVSRTVLHTVNSIGILWYESELVNVQFNSWVC